MWYVWVHWWWCILFAGHGFVRTDQNSNTVHNWHCWNHDPRNAGPNPLLKGGELTLGEDISAGYLKDHSVPVTDLDEWYELPRTKLLTESQSGIRLRVG